MKTVPFITKYKVFIAIVITALIAVFYLLDDIREASLSGFTGATSTVASALICDTTLIDEEILSLQRSKDDVIRIRTHFNEKPTFDARDYFLENGVAIYMNTWTGDYLTADMRVQELCFMANLPGVTKLSIEDI